MHSNDRKIALVVGVLLMAGLFGGWASFPAQAGDPLTIATEGAYRPFNDVRADGQLFGFDVDIAKALCRVMRRECTIIAHDWDTIIDDLVAGKYDAIVASMSVTDERKQRVSFTNKYYSTPMRFVAARGSGLSATPSGLMGRRVGVQSGTTGESYARKHFGDSILVTFPSVEAATAALTKGEIDTTISDALVVWKFLRSGEGRDYEFIGDPIRVDSEIAIAVRLGESELRSDFNRAIARILVDGTYEMINEKYFPFSIY